MKARVIDRKQFCSSFVDICDNKIGKLIDAIIVSCDGKNKTQNVGL